MTQPATDTTSPGLLRQGFDAFKANAVAAVILWIVGTAIVVSYYTLEPFHETLNDVAAFKDHVGIFYAMAAMALFCGLIPYCMQGLQRGGRRNFAPRYLVFLLIFWAIKGIEVDMLYIIQAELFGHDNHPLTIAPKILVDQFVYVPFWAVPTMVLGMMWASHGYSVARVRQRMAGNWYRHLILPVMVTNWFVWVPSVVLIYTLPTALQLPVQNIIACMWVLMVMFMTGDREAAS